MKKVFTSVKRNVGNFYFLKKELKIQKQAVKGYWISKLECLKDIYLNILVGWLAKVYSLM